MGEKTSEKKKQGVKREFSAGGLVFKKTPGKKEEDFLWLAIKPKGVERWQFPKGHVEEGESQVKAAEREASEEGGVSVKVLSKLGSNSYFYVWEKEKRFKVVSYYLMQYEEDLKAGIDKNEIDKAQFFTKEELFKILTFKEDKEMLKKALDILKRGIQPVLL